MNITVDRGKGRCLVFNMLYSGHGGSGGRKDVGDGRGRWDGL